MTVELPTPIDPVAVVHASRRAGEPWFCLEQPDRGGFVIAALGCAHALEESGPDRFGALAEQWRSLAAGAIADDPHSLPGAGLVALGGFAFAPSGGASATWRGYAPASLHVPELCLVRHGEQACLTVVLEVPSDGDPDALSAAAERRLSDLPLAAELPLIDPAPVGEYEVSSSMPPAHYELAVSRAIDRIEAGAFEKVVLAREVDVHAPVDHDAAAVLGLLRASFPSSFTYAVGRDDATFLGATPELLIRREGQRASTVALAGSSRRSADPAVDDHLGEQLMRSDKNRSENAIVARRIASALGPVSVWVTTASEPAVVRVANIQHLATPIRAQLAQSLDAITLAGRLHPTPAVGAEPASAVEEIPALEGFDRGWYAGSVGWVDATGDGEFCVALRGALLRGRDARCFAGCGIVRDSDPSAELAETEIKLGVMLPALAG